MKGEGRIHAVVTVVVVGVAGQVGCICVMLVIDPCVEWMPHTIAYMVTAAVGIRRNEERSISMGHSPSTLLKIPRVKTRLINKINANVIAIAVFSVTSDTLTPDRNPPIYMQTTKNFPDHIGQRIFITHMRCVIQRVSSASVSVDGQIVSKIGPGQYSRHSTATAQVQHSQIIMLKMHPYGTSGLLCLVGIHANDQEEDAEWVARRIVGMRLWPNPATGKAWDLSLPDQSYDCLCVSQFTLHGRLKGNKPDYSKAMGPQPARLLYDRFIGRLKAMYDADRIKDGVFGAMMSVELVNDGPVTFIVDSVVDRGRSGNESNDGGVDV